MSLPKISISYKKKDAGRLRIAQDVRRILEQQHGFKTWLDEDIRGGKAWRKEIENKLNWADNFLLLVFDDTHNGNTILYEIWTALKKLSIHNYKNVVCLIMENGVDDKYIKRVEDILLERYLTIPTSLSERQYISLLEHGWEGKIELSFYPIIKKDQERALNNIRKAFAKKYQNITKLYEALIYLIKPFNVKNGSLSASLKNLRENLIQISQQDEKEILKILENDKILVKTGETVWIRDDKFGQKLIEEVFLADEPLMKLEIIEALFAQRTKSILSSLSEINSPKATAKLREYAVRIKRSITKRTNDERFNGLDLLEKFSFKVPREALDVASMFANPKMEKESVKSTHPYPHSGIKHAYVMEKSLDILRRYNLRYGFFDKTFKTLLEFYQFKLADDTYGDIRKKASEIILEMAKYDLRVILPKGTDGKLFLGYRFQEVLEGKVRRML